MTITAPFRSVSPRCVNAVLAGLVVGTWRATGSRGVPVAVRGRWATDTWYGARWALFAGIGLSILAGLVMQLLQSVHVALRGPSSSTYPATVVAVLELVGAVVLAPIAEEIAFRGVLQEQLLARLPGRAWLALCLTAVVFGIAHVGLMGYGASGFLSTTLLGWGFGWLAWRTGRLVPSMAAHGVHNAVMVGLWWNEDITAAVWAGTASVLFGSVFLRAWWTHRPWRPAPAT